MDNPNLAEQIITIGRYMLKTGLVVGTWGNISIRLPEENSFLITPSGMDYDQISVADLVTMDLEENVINGDKKPSSEYHLHLEIYKARADINAVVHTHSNYGTAFAVARKPIPAVVEDIAQLNGGPVAVAEYTLPGTQQLALGAVKALKENFAVLLANHGVVGTGRNLAEAVKMCQLVEKTAQIMIMSSIIGNPVELSTEDIATMHNFFLNQYGQK